jgi:hypothetical protein
VINTDIVCEAVGDAVSIKSNLFQYKRVGEITTLELIGTVTLDEVHVIKEVISFYEELISLNS